MNGQHNQKAQNQQQNGGEQYNSKKQNYTYTVSTNNPTVDEGRPEDSIQVGNSPEKKAKKTKKRNKKKKKAKNQPGPNNTQSCDVHNNNTNDNHEYEYLEESSFEDLTNLKKVLNSGKNHAGQPLVKSAAEEKKVFKLTDKEKL